MGTNFVAGPVVIGEGQWF